LSRDDIEWLLVTHENGRGPVERHDENMWRLAGLDLRAADLRQTNLNNLPLTRMNGGLSKGDAMLATPEQCEMAGVHLEGADLHWAHLERASLLGARLEGAFLVGAHLERANLTRTHLEGAFLNKVHFEKAHLHEAHLEGAVLREAFLILRQILKALSSARRRLASPRWSTFAGVVRIWP